MITTPNSMRAFPAMGVMSPRDAFTLVELLVAIAVLALILAAIGSIISSTSIITGSSHRRMDADSQARMVFDRMAGDFSRLVNRTDVDYDFNHQANNDSLYFYSEGPATAANAPSTLNSGSLIGYRVNTTASSTPQNDYKLERMGYGLSWSPGVPAGSLGMVFLSDASSSPASASTISGAFSSVISANSNYQVLSEGVFRLEYCFLLKPYTKLDGTLAPASYSNNPYNPTHSSIYQGLGLSDVQAIVVTLAILDANNRKILPSTVNWSTIVGLFTDPTDANLAASPPVLPAQTWQAEVDTGGLAAAASIPPTAAAGVRIYQRIFPLIPNSP